MHKYKLTLAYDGTHYGGWQVQPNATSIQTLVQEALSIALRTPTCAVGSGRTDAGVHALGQVAHFTHPTAVNCHTLCLSLNALLPPAIRALSMTPVPLTFHARFSATGKVYHYHLHLASVLDPFKKGYCTHVLHPVDLELLRLSAQQLVGTHDFAAFASAGHGVKDTVRTLKRVDVCEEMGGVRLEFEGNGFLYKMVRTSVGTLLDINRGKIRLEELPDILRSRDRRRAGVSAPPQGLFLVSVEYRPDHLESR